MSKMWEVDPETRRKVRTRSRDMPGFVFAVAGPSAQSHRHSTSLSDTACEQCVIGLVKQTANSTCGALF